MKVTKKALLILLLVFTSNAIASTIPLSAIYSGWYNDNGTSNGSEASLLTGNDNGTLYRSWIGFDLSGITEAISSATLNIKNETLGPSIIVKWSAVTTQFSVLSSIDPNPFNNFAPYTDLGDGTIYATGPTTGGTLNSFTLNLDGITALNNAADFFAFGGSTTDSGKAFGNTTGVFTEGQTIELVLNTIPPSSVVPVPAAAWLFGSGLLTLFGFARRKTS